MLCLHKHIHQRKNVRPATDWILKFKSCYPCPLSWLALTARFPILTDLLVCDNSTEMERRNHKRQGLILWLAVSEIIVSCIKQKHLATKSGFIFHYVNAYHGMHFSGLTWPQSERQRSREQWKPVIKCYPNKQIRASLCYDLHKGISVSFFMLAARPIFMSNFGIKQADKGQISDRKEIKKLAF